MGVIKTRISDVYAKARDRVSTKVYRKGKVMKPNLNLRTVHFCSGNTSLLKTSSVKLGIYSNLKVQIPEKTFEVVRLAIIKKLDNCFPGILKSEYCLVFNKYPHQLLRFHAIASGARADRLSQGMSCAFGTNFMKALKINPKDKFLEVMVSKKYEANLALLKPHLKKVMCKLPFTGYIA